MTVIVTNPYAQDCSFFKEDLSNSSSLENSYVSMYEVSNPHVEFLYTPDFLQRKVSVENKVFSSASLMMLEVEMVYQHLMLLARIVNFMQTGEEYEIIDNPEQFKKDYAEALSEDPDAFECRCPFRVSGYGRFDTSSVTTPYIDEKASEFIFYVQKGMVPYKVHCKLPIQEGPLNMSYKCLPYQSLQKS